MKLTGILLVGLGVLLLVVLPPMGMAGTLILIGLIMFVIGKDKRKARKAKAAGQRKTAVLDESIKVEDGNWECANCHARMLLAEENCWKCGRDKNDVAIRLLNQGGMSR